jgi:hypothetical protein
MAPHGTTFAAAGLNDRNNQADAVLALSPRVSHDFDSWMPGECLSPRLGAYAARAQAGGAGWTRRAARARLKLLRADRLRLGRGVRPWPSIAYMTPAPARNPATLASTLLGGAPVAHPPSATLSLSPASPRGLHPWGTARPWHTNSAAAALRHRVHPATAGPFTVGPTPAAGAPAGALPAAATRSSSGAAGDSAADTACGPLGHRAGGSRLAGWHEEEEEEEEDKKSASEEEVQQAAATPHPAPGRAPPQRPHVQAPPPVAWAVPPPTKPWLAPGQLVWAKMPRFPFWPAFVLADGDAALPVACRGRSAQPGRVPVRFFGPGAEVGSRVEGERAGWTVQGCR